MCRPISLYNILWVVLFVTKMDIIYFLSYVIDLAASNRPIPYLTANKWQKYKHQRNVK